MCCGEIDRPMEAHARVGEIKANKFACTKELQQRNWRNDALSGIRARARVATPAELWTCRVKICTITRSSMLAGGGGGLLDIGMEWIDRIGRTGGGMVEGEKKKQIAHGAWRVA